MSRMDHMKNLWDRAKSEPDLAALEKATSVWRSAAEAEKLELETSNLKRTMRSETARFWVPVMATIISSTALVGTLLFQITQFKENTRLQTEAAEDAQYREALKSVQNPERIHGAVGIPLLKSFFDSRRYGKQAREVGLKVMQGTVDYDSFQSVFDPIADRVGWSDYRDVVRLEAALYEQWGDLSGDVDKLERNQKVTEASKGLSSPRDVPPLPFPGEPVLNRPGRPPIGLGELKHYAEETRKELMRCEEFLSQFLKRNRPSGAVVDLSAQSSVYLGGTDLRGVNLKGATLTDVIFDESKIDGADLSKVTEFEGSSWENVAWWRAEKMSEPLLGYLKKSYQYSRESVYNGPATQDEYALALARLDRASADAAEKKE